MKKSIILSILMSAALIFACSPIEERDEMTGHLTAEELQVTATPVVVNGVNSNKIILENHSPVLSSWNYGTGTTSKAYDEVLVTSTGDIVITFTGRNGDGTTITKDLHVNVESIVFEVTGMDLFIGDGSKTWVFDAFTDNNHPYGIGGVGDKFASWWGPEYGDFSEWDAKITFALDGGAIFTKTLADGTEQKGTFSFDLSKTAAGGWSQGILSLKGATIPNAYSINNKAGEAYDFYIVTLADDQLILANVTGNGVPTDPSGEANFWMFRPEGFTLADNSEQIAILSGGSERTWGWGKGNVWGNGGPGSKGPGWWMLDSDGVDGQKPGEGTGASMVFTSDGKLTLNLNDGTSIAGTYKVNMGKTVEGWTIGLLTTEDVYVPCGFSPNAPDKPRVYEYHIVILDETQMVLAHVYPDNPDEAWYWIFTPSE